jgi:hypothetical protein
VPPRQSPVGLDVGQTVWSCDWRVGRPTSHTNGQFVRRLRLPTNIHRGAPMLRSSTVTANHPAHAIDWENRSWHTEKPHATWHSREGTRHVAHQEATFAPGCGGCGARSACVTDHLRRPLRPPTRPPGRSTGMGWPPPQQLRHQQQRQQQQWQSPALARQETSQWLPFCAGCSR